MEIVVQVEVQAEVKGKQRNVASSLISTSTFLYEER
jgi:hypothetical protein